MVTAIVVVPYVYLFLPAWLASSVFGLGLLSVLYFAAEPVLPNRWMLWFTTLAFGRSSGLTALALTIAALGAMLGLIAVGVLGTTVPAMLVLGPLIVLLDAYCAHHVGPERTTRQYLEAEPPLGRQRSTPEVG